VEIKGEGKKEPGRLDDLWKNRAGKYEITFIPHHFHQSRRKGKEGVADHYCLRGKRPGPIISGLFTSSEGTEVPKEGEGCG